MPIGVQQLLLAEKTSQAAIDGDANTILLLHCDGADGSASFIDQSGWAPANTATPTGATVTTTTQQFGQSASFNGSSNIIVTPSANFNFGSGNFTIDFWFRLNSLASSQILAAKSLSSSTLGLLIYFDGVHVLVDASSNGTSFDLVLNLSAGAPTANTWYHFAVVRFGNTWTAYLNGVGAGQVTTAATAIAANTLGFSIGAYGDGTPGAMSRLNGFIDEFRISNVARWSTPSFTPPAAPYAYAPPPTGGDANTLLLLHGDGANGSTSFPDSSARHHAVTPNGTAKISTAQSKFGGASMAFDATGSYLSLDGSADFAFGTGDFTIEFWIRFNSVGTVLIYDGNPGTIVITPVIYLISNTFRYRTNAVDVITGTTAPVANTWYHVAVVRSSGATKLYINGTQEGVTYTDANNYILGGANRPLIGTNSGAIGGNGINGFLEEFRISNIARWTANFTPPTVPYP